MNINVDNPKIDGVITNSTTNEIKKDEVVTNATTNNGGLVLGYVLITDRFGGKKWVKVYQK